MTKRLSEASKITALTGFLSASKEHKLQGIRPKGSNAQHIRIANPGHAARAGQAIADGFETAAAKWPDENQWNMDGCDAVDGIGNWIMPSTYAEFGSYDEEDGENPGQAPDGFQ